MMMTAHSTTIRLSILTLLIAHTSVAFSPLNHRKIRVKDSRLLVSRIDQDDPPRPLFESFADDIVPVLMADASPMEPPKNSSIVDGIMSTYIGPRLVLAATAAVYGTNFALGSIMNDALPASAATASRMMLASTVLLPFAFQIKPSLRLRACMSGALAAMGYVTQSMALVDTDPSRVSFLGAATVLWCPVLEWLIDKKPMGLKQAPQTWLAALLCLTGVGILELQGDAGNLLSSAGMGDLLSLIQAFGFSSGCFISAKLVTEEPTQVLPITSVIIATTACLSMIWCMLDGGWLELGGLSWDARPVILAVLWTGLVSTALNVVVEISALRHVPPSEASVLLASEPVWAALFASVLVNETLGMNDYVGGAFIVAACLVNAVLKPSDILKLVGDSKEKEE